MLEVVLLVLGYLTVAEAYSAPPDPLAGVEESRCPSPRTPPPLSALWASDFGLSGRNFLRLGKKHPGYGPVSSYRLV